MSHPRMKTQRRKQSSVEPQIGICALRLDTRRGDIKEVRGIACFLFRAKDIRYAKQSNRTDLTIVFTLSALSRTVIKPSDRLESLSIVSLQCFKLGFFNGDWMYVGRIQKVGRR